MDVQDREYQPKEDVDETGDHRPALHYSRNQKEGIARSPNVLMEQCLSGVLILHGAVKYSTL